MEKWILMYSIKQGKLLDVVQRLASPVGLLTNALKQLPYRFLLQLFSLMAGEGLPPNTKLVQSYLKRDARSITRGRACFYLFAIYVKSFL